jgi:hypothetical protein
MNRRARVLVAAGVAVLLAASAAYLGITLTYRVEYGSLFGGGVAGVRDDPHGTVDYPLWPGNRVRVTVSVRNPGSLPITLEDVSFDTPDLAIDELSLGSYQRPGEPEQAEPFHPVDLNPRAEAVVLLTLRITGANPYEPCSSFALVSIDVRYRVLGMPRSQSIDLPTGLSFEAACDKLPL